MSANVPTTEMGIASAIATGYLGSLRKRKRTRNASTPPKTSAWKTLVIESAMKLAWSSATSMCMAGYSSCYCSSTSSTARATVTVLAPDSLKTSRPTDSSPA